MTGNGAKIVRLTAIGGLAFWVANLAISLTPIAAEYRAALSIPYLPMLVEALVGGLLIALGVSWALVRQPAALPKTSPVGQALLLSLIALVLVTVGIELPSKVLVASANPVRYFLIGAAFNTVRIVALGVAIAARRAPAAIRDPQPSAPGSRLPAPGSWGHPDSTAERRRPHLRVRAGVGPRRQGQHVGTR